jgi:hypothetical protein
VVGEWLEGGEMASEDTVCRMLHYVSTGAGESCKSIKVVFFIAQSAENIGGTGPYG